jgi:peptide/nickel transport system substrate-binding protein
MIRKAGVAAAAFLFMISVTVSAQPRQGGVMTYCESEFPRSFDPITAEDDIVNVRFTTMVFEGLFAYDINREIVNRLAEGYRIEDGGRRVTVSLRRGARWSDGRDVTAYDVRATVDAIRSSGNQQERRIISDITDVSVRDNYTLTVTFDRPLLQEVILRKLTFKILPRHKLPANTPLTRQSEIAREPLGSGFYQVVRRGPTDLVMQANDNYRRRGSSVIGPHIDEVRMYVQTDVGTQIEFLLNQQVDVLVEVPPPAIARLRASGFQIKPYESLSYHFIAFNFNHPILKNRNVRQAMTYGFNRENALDRIYQNQGSLISGPFPPSSAFYVRDLDAGPFPYDTEEAVRLLIRAGFEARGTDGIRRNANGERLAFTLVVPRFEGDDFGPRVVAQFVSDMRRIGIEIELVELEFERWISRVKYEHAYDLAFAAVVFDEAGNIAPLFLSTNNRPGQENFTGYNNAEVDALLERARISTDPAERININRRLHRMLREECPFIFLWSLNKNAAAHQKVRNFMTRVTPFSFFDYVNEWYIRDAW